MKEPYLVEQGMTERNVSDSELLLQREILGLIEKRKRQYGKCYIRSVLPREKDTLINACTRIELLRSDSGAPVLTHYTYDDLKMRSYVTEISNLIELLDHLLKYGVLKLPDSHVECDGSLRKVEFFTLNSSDNPVFKIGYPFDPFYFIPTDQSKIRMPSRRPLVAVDQPLFPDAYDAAKTFLGFDLRQWSQFNGNVVFLFPNYSARISNVEIGSDHVKVSITPQ